MLTASIILYLITIISTDGKIVGIIRNASLLTSNNSITLQESSCEMCLCVMWNGMGNDSILSLNCLTNSNNTVTCVMFTESIYLSSSVFGMVNDVSSTFYFQQLPSVNNSTSTTLSSTSSNYFLKILEFS